MPYKLKKSGSGYKVTSPGRSYSKHPMSKAKAKRQLAALHMHTHEGPDVDKELAKQSHEEEERAIHDYGDRAKKASDPNLKKVFLHAKGEEEEHEKEFKPFTEASIRGVFIIREAPIQNRPPPGSQPVKPTDYVTMGTKGQALQKGMQALQSAGDEMNAYKTPSGDIEAFPKDAAPGRGPMKADVTKGIWAPVTGSAKGTPFSSQSPTTTTTQ
jgi:hypothetical protein